MQGLNEIEPTSRTDLTCTKQPCWQYSAVLVFGRAGANFEQTTLFYFEIMSAATHAQPYPYAWTVKFEMRHEAPKLIAGLIHKHIHTYREITNERVAIIFCPPWFPSSDLASGFPFSEMRPVSPHFNGLERTWGGCTRTLPALHSELRDPCLHIPLQGLSSGRRL